ncbi:MAG: hypothetical protein ACU85V_20255 [Gammaproteobacteria bacterium]
MRPARCLRRLPRAALAAALAAIAVPSGAADGAFTPDYGLGAGEPRPSSALVLTHGNLDLGAPAATLAEVRALLLAERYRARSVAEVALSERLFDGAVKAGEPPRQASSDFLVERSRSSVLLTPGRI